MVLGARRKLYKSTTEAPPAGVSGTYHDHDNKIVHVYYGNDHLEQHMAHLIDNHRQYPHNDRPFDVAPEHSVANRAVAMAKSALRPTAGLARDEKPPNIADHDHQSVTVQHLPAKESSKHFLE